MPVSKLIVLGGSTTALAVIRDAYRIGIQTVLFDTKNDIASKSAIPIIKVLQQATDEQLKDEVIKLGENKRNYLIATSDEWLRFVIKYRNEFEDSYYKTIHSENEALAICLDKELFTEWCAQNSISTPKRYDAVGLLKKRESATYPLLIRPSRTHHQKSSHKLPKAIEVNNFEELLYWCDRFEQENVKPFITESLLSHKLVQYSVAIARSNTTTVSFVAVKKRPSARSCAVGTYVELSPNNEVENLAREATRLLEYYGIAEVEILQSVDQEKNYIIEINARPWLQYELAQASGHDFLKFLLDPSNYNLGKAVKSGKRWLDFRNDLYVCFSKQHGMVRNGEISFMKYCSSLWNTNVFANYNKFDLKPILYDIVCIAKMTIGKKWFG